MRLREFSNAANETQFIRFIFQKILYALNERYKKRLKIYKNKQRIAKQKLKNKRLKSYRNMSNFNNVVNQRPKRLK